MKASIKFGQRYPCIDVKLNQRSIQRENKYAHNDYSEYTMSAIPYTINFIAVPFPLYNSE